LPSPTERPIGVLALLDDPAPIQPLLLELRSQGIRVDVARDLAGARVLFFGAGGHDCLVVAHDVRPALATRVLQSLRTVDPGLPTATFGPDLRRNESPTRTAMLASFHPGSRAGAGALLRFLRALSPR
jgi:hypothetical protein